jgi:mannose-6-phosphate isomerase-like protein (cupin superfamily)
VSLEFELRGVVIAGVLGLEFKEETAKFNVNEGFVIPKNTKVRIHNAGNVPLHLVEILRPGYKESLVKEYESFE